MKRFRMIGVLAAAAMLLAAGSAFAQVREQTLRWATANSRKTSSPNSTRLHSPVNGS